mgnify:FL=1
MNISVIIPAYNRASVLGRALDSVFAQTRQATEVIVVDDGSVDDTTELVRSRYPRVQYLRQDHRGVSAARNHGMQAARHEWLAFLDSDDEWLPGKLGRQCQVILNKPDIRICHTDETWIRRGRRVNPMKKHAKQGGYIFLHCLPRCVISPSSVLIHRTVLDRVGMFDETLPACEDYDLWLRICAQYPVTYIPEPLITKYGGHADQLSRHFWGMDRFRIHALEKLVNREDLTSNEQEAVLLMLLEKIRIIQQGARKRGNHRLADDCESKAVTYRELLQCTTRGAAKRPGHD